jgi:tetratricopeptide (TPR) repeat protein
LALVAYLAYRYFVWIPERQNRARAETAASAGLAHGAEQKQAPPERAAAEAERATAAIVAKEGEEAQPTEQATTTPIAEGQSGSSLPKAGSEGEIAAPKRSIRAPLPPTSTSEDRNFATGETDSPARSKANMPRNFDSLLSQGDHLRERERPAAALRAYAKAVELEPDRPEPLTGRGLALIDLGRLAEAEKSLQQALKLDPKSSVALMGLAEAYRAEGKKSEAIRYYEKYLEVLPNGSEASVARSAIKALRE